MRTIYLLALALPLLAGCKDDDCEGKSGSSNSDRGYFMIGFYMTDAATGQPLILDSLAPYRPDSVRVLDFNGGTIYPRLGTNAGPQYGYVAPPWDLEGSDFIHPAPYNDTAYFYIVVAYNDTDTLKIIRHSTGDCKKPWRYTYLFRGVPQPYVNYLPGQNTPADNINVINIRKPMQ